MDEPMNFNRSWALVRKHWRPFLLVGVVAIALSGILSGPWFIKPRYRSQAVVYPVNLNSYSIETRADQLMQLLESNSIRDSIIAHFGLVEHYRIDTAATGGRALLYNLYNERVTINKTRYESVDIRVTDEDPVMAHDMVQAILEQVDLLARRLQRKNSAELLAVIRHDLARTGHQLDSIEGRLNELRQVNGLLDYSTQAKEFTKGYVRSLSAGSGRPRQEILDGLRSLEEHGGEFLQLSRMGADLLAEYDRKLADERQALLDVNKVLTYSNVVIYPEVPDKKVFPIRWLIVLASTAGALLFLYVLLFLREQSRGSSHATGRAR